MKCIMNNIYVYTHIGNSRTNQEDNYFIGKGKFLSPSNRDLMMLKRSCFMDKCQSDERICCFVSDGMGGHSSGEVASLFVVNYIDENFEQLFGQEESDVNLIKKFVKELNDALCCEAKLNNNCDMGATLCGVISCGEKTLCVNAGDSRAYLVNDGKISQITVDNTEGQRLLDLRLLTKEELDDFPKRKAIYKYIGKEIELIPDIYEVQNISQGSFILLCSDGLSDVMTNDEILEIMEKKYITTEDKGKFLVEIAAEKNKDMGDNITLIIIEF